jgi:hypothetical protein
MPGLPEADSPVPAMSQAAIRDWARQQGLEVRDRGRVPASVRALYEAALEPAPARLSVELPDQR